MTLDRAANAAALDEYTSSYNMRGITVELTVAVRPATLIRTVTASLPTDAELPAALLRVRRWAGQDAESCASACSALPACGSGHRVKMHHVSAAACAHQHPCLACDRRPACCRTESAGVFDTCTTSNHAANADNTMSTCTNVHTKVAASSTHACPPGD